MRKMKIILLALVLTFTSSYIFISKDRESVPVAKEVIVKQPVLESKVVIDSCVGVKDVFPTTCLTQYFQELASKTSFKESNALLEKYAKESNGFDGLCHSVGHDFGAWSYEKYGSAVLKQVTDICGFSVGHGMLQEAGKLLPKAQFLKDFSDFCKYSQELSGCVHGYGHGLWQSKYTTIEIGVVCTGVAASLQKLFPNNTDPLTSLCTEGWMMEDLINNPDFWGEDQTIEAAIALCKGLSGEAYYGCSDIAVSNWAISPKLYQKNPLLAQGRLTIFRDYCISLDGIAEKYCFGHLGYTISTVIAGATAGDKVAPLLIEFCSGDKSTYCIGSYINSIFGLLDGNVSFLTDLCKKLPVAWKETCKNESSK